MNNFTHFSVEYQQFLSQPSGNMDDTGFFSVQVISRALNLHNLELIPFDSSDEFACQCRADPTIASAFIFNMKEHWYCVRRFLDGTQRSDTSPPASPSASVGGKQRTAWFNLNSVFSKPEFMSSLYITEYIKQMRKESYSVFVIKGCLPPCQSDTIPPVFRPLTPEELAAKRVPIIDLTKSPKREDDEMQRAIQESLKSAGLSPDTFKFAKTGSSMSRGNKVHTLRSGDMELEEAVKLSMEAFGGPKELAPPPIIKPLSVEELRQRRLANYGKRPETITRSPQQSTSGESIERNLSPVSHSQLSTALKLGMERLSQVSPEGSTAQAARQESQEAIIDSINVSNVGSEQPGTPQLELSAALQLSMECFGDDDETARSQPNQASPIESVNAANTQTSSSALPSMPSLERTDSASSASDLRAKRLAYFNNIK